MQFIKVLNKNISIEAEVFIGKKVGTVLIFITTKKEDDMATNHNPEHKEGPLATAIEEQTAKLPSDLFLWAAVGSIAVSLVLQVTGIKKKSLFVGQWVAPFLVLGLYNKLVKLEGHD